MSKKQLTDKTSPPQRRGPRTLKGTDLTPEDINKIREHFKRGGTMSGLREVYKEIIESKKKSQRKHTAMAIHAISQLYGDSKQLSLFSDERIDEFTRGTGMKLLKRPESYGVVLNQSQRRVLEGVLRAFSDTNYMGAERIEKEEEFKKRDITKTVTLAKAYSNIDKIPVIRLTQAELIKLSGYKRRQGDKVDVMEGLSFLATKQFCFYWVRLKKDENGKPVKDKNGDYRKEEVMEVGTLFRVGYVKEGEEFKYYEISPSSVILDQVNKSYGGNYFLLVPNDWREEAKKLTGKRGSSYTYEFLFWLRLQYEQIRRYNIRNKNKKPFTLSRNWEEIAIALKMPPSMYKANRKTASKIIQNAYNIATKLGYLLKVETGGATDVLYLNEKYYPQPGKLI